MSKAAPKSCYVLELSVSPGGSRWAEVHAYTRLQKPILRPGESTPVTNPWFDAKKARRVATHVHHELVFGSYDEEGGIDLDPPFTIDENES